MIEGKVIQKIFLIKINLVKLSYNIKLSLKKKIQVINLNNRIE